MKAKSGRPNSLREPAHRITALVVVITWHLGLLTLLLRPATFYRETTQLVRSDSSVLKLRFIQPPRSPPLHSAPQLIAPPVHRRMKSSAMLSKKPLVQQTAEVAAPPYETSSTSVGSRDAGQEGSDNDGGFKERLRNAQHAHSIHGIPGPNAAFAPGIQLVDPMSQGIGALMRHAQRAFGIKSRRCIDVDAWRRLSPQELSARHVSPSEVDSVDEKYACNKPPGLHF